MKKERLTIEDRIIIEELVKLNYKLKDIANVINVHPSTISREIKNRRISDNKKETCSKTNKYPFICYNCPKKVHCNKNRFYYNYKVAQKDYDNKLKYSRVGIDMSIDEVEYAILTNDIYKEWSGMKASEYKAYKGLRKESLRDNMTDIEVVLTDLGEIATRELAKEHKPYGLEQNKKIAKMGGSAAKAARDNIEKKLGKTVISNKNSLNYEYIDEKLLEEKN